MSWRKLMILAVLGAACASSSSDPPRSKLVYEVENLDERALMLLMVDRKLFEPFIVTRLQEENLGLSTELAISLGRIGDPRGRFSLEEMLAAEQAEVRRAAAFALGQLGEKGAADALLRAVADPDAETGRLSIEALARLEVDLAEVIAAAGELGQAAFWARLLPSLFLFDNQKSLPVAAEALKLENRELHAWAAYALARNPLPEGADLLRPLVDDRDPWVRGWAARALGRVGGREDLERLRPLLDDPESGPTIHALRAAKALIDAGKTAPPTDWRPRLLELMDDPRPGVRVTAIEASAAWLLTKELGGVLAVRSATGPAAEREAALLALAEGGDPRAGDLVVQWAGSGDERQRIWAAEAAAVLGEELELAMLMEDPAAGVRLAALAGLLGEENEQSADWARFGLEDTDPAMRSSALEWLEAHPEVTVDELMLALGGPGGRRFIELSLNGVAAVAARGTHEPLERGSAIAALESLARVLDYPVRRAAADALTQFDRPRPPVGIVSTALTMDSYREIVRLTWKTRFAEIRTRHGLLRLRLACPLAPLTCNNFLQLANQGFYDGLEFHRVIADFVVQGGDPRGDGWGGPGYTIRDEVGRLRYDRGVVGMALSGPDTAGSQFFITLSRQPHLDGIFTAFGEVVAGFEILDLIAKGDRILEIVEVE
ncbi:MAG: peptidylprolyl isomerase [Thermoanaerobaculia bacterium]